MISLGLTVDSFYAKSLIGRQMAIYRHLGAIANSAHKVDAQRPVPRSISGMRSGIIEIARSEWRCKAMTTDAVVRVRVAVRLR